MARTQRLHVFGVVRLHDHSHHCMAARTLPSSHVASYELELNVDATEQLRLNVRGDGDGLSHRARPIFNALKGVPRTPREPPSFMVIPYPKGTPVPRIDPVRALRAPRTALRAEYASRCR